MILFKQVYHFFHECCAVNGMVQIIYDRHLCLMNTGYRIQSITILIIKNTAEAVSFAVLRNLAKIRFICWRKCLFSVTEITQALKKE